MVVRSVSVLFVSWVCGWEWVLIFSTLLMNINWVDLYNVWSGVYIFEIIFSFIEPGWRGGGVVVVRAGWRKEGDNLWFSAVSLSMVSQSQSSQQCRAMSLIHPASESNSDCIWHPEPWMHVLLEIGILWE